MRFNRWDLERESPADQREGGKEQELNTWETVTEERKKAIAAKRHADGGHRRDIDLRRSRERACRLLAHRWLVPAPDGRITPHDMVGVGVLHVSPDDVLA